MGHALDIAKLEKAYGAQRVLRGVSFSVQPGSILGLLGPNGAGKSTLIRSIMGIVEPDAGTMKIMGQPWSRASVRTIGYLPEERGLYKDMKVGEQALYFARLKGMDKADAVRSLRHWFDRLEVEEWWDKKVSDISKGMAQKIQFICSIVHRPELIILDEPLSGFDPLNARRIIDVIRELAQQGTAVVLSTHDMPSVERLCDHVVLLHEGRVVLSGEAESMRESHWKGQQVVLFRGTDLAFTHALGAMAHLEGISSTSMEGERRATIQLRDGVDAGRVLSALQEAVNLVEFIKVRPTMESLFIDAVSSSEDPFSASA